MTALGIHPGQIPILLLLAKRVEMSQREIAEELCCKAPDSECHGTAYGKGRSGSAGDMMKKDQRITRIFLTDQGYEMKKKVAEQIELNERYAFMGFSDAEKCLFRRFMEQIITNISCIPEEKTTIYRKRRG